MHNAAINVDRAPPPAVSLEAHHGAAGGPTPQEAVEQREWLDWLMGAIGGLPARQRAALVGHALEGRSYQDLASREQTTVSAIKTLIHRARRGLAEGSPRHALAAPFVLVSRRLAGGLAGFTARRALAGKLSANGMVGMLAAAIGTATLTSGLLLAVHGGHSAAAIAASQRQGVGVRAGAHHRRGAGGNHAPQPERSPAARLHHEARQAMAECEHGRRLDRRLRGAALRYAASHLDAALMEYSNCGHVLRGRALQLARDRRHTPLVPGAAGTPPLVPGAAGTPPLVPGAAGTRSPVPGQAPRHSLAQPKPGLGAAPTAPLGSESP